MNELFVQCIALSLSLSLSHTLSLSLSLSLSVAPAGMSVGGVVGGAVSGAVGGVVDGGSSNYDLDDFGDETMIQETQDFAFVVRSKLASEHKQKSSVSGFEVCTYI